MLIRSKLKNFNNFHPSFLLKAKNIMNIRSPWFYCFVYSGVLNFCLSTTIRNRQIKKNTKKNTSKLLNLVRRLRCQLALQIIRYYRCNGNFHEYPITKKAFDFSCIDFLCSSVINNLKINYLFHNIYQLSIFL